MTVTLSNNPESELPWQELHHIALATSDLEETVRFYTEVLGMQADNIQPTKSVVTDLP